MDVAGAGAGAGLAVAATGAYFRCDTSSTAFLAFIGRVSAHAVRTHDVQLCDKRRSIGYDCFDGSLDVSEPVLCFVWRVL